MANLKMAIAERGATHHSFVTCVYGMSVTCLQVDLTCPTDDPLYQFTGRNVSLQIRKANKYK